jgi:predicted RNA-binding protein with PUA-like domain
MCNKVNPILCTVAGNGWILYPEIFFDPIPYLVSRNPVSNKFLISPLTELTNLKLYYMAYWLVKSEPEVYPWEQLVKDKQTFWDGVRNYAARLHLRAMKNGDQVLYYHSNEGMDIVGIATVVKEAYQDPTTDDDRWVAVDLAAHKKLKHPVTLDTIKKDKRLANMALVRIGRLSVQPVTDEEWSIIMKLAGEK